MSKTMVEDLLRWRPFGTWYRVALFLEIDVKNESVARLCSEQLQ